MQAVRPDPDQNVPRPNRLWVGDAAAIDDTDREPRQIIFAGLIQIAGLAGFATHQARSGHLTSARDTLDDVDNDLLLKFSYADVIEKEERPRTVTDDVVDTHRHTIDSDGVVASGREGDLQLGSHAVRSRYQYRTAHPACRAVDRDQRAEAANSADHLRARGSGGDAAKDRHQCLLERDVHTCRLVRHPRRHQLFSFRTARAEARQARVWSW